MSFKVEESVRRVISKDGAQIILENIVEVDTTGSWTRMKDARGQYILVNPDNVLAYIIKGEAVR